MNKSVQSIVFEQDGVELTATLTGNGEVELVIDELGSVGVPASFVVKTRDVAIVASTLLTLIGADGIAYRLPWGAGEESTT